MLTWLDMRDGSDAAGMGPARACPFPIHFPSSRIIAMAVFAGSRNAHWATEAAVGLLILFALAFLFSSARPAHAQDESAPATEQGNPSEAVQSQPRLFTHIIRSAGPVFGLILLAVSIA